MIISAADARPYFEHKTQQRGFTPDQLPEGPGFMYFADGGICVLFHDALWPGVFMAHYGVKPEFWGHLDKSALKILNYFWNLHHPKSIVGWTEQRNRAAISFAKRLGFTEYGRHRLPSGTVILQEWRKWD